jgi:hypothetical protein
MALAIWLTIGFCAAFSWLIVWLVRPTPLHPKPSRLGQYWTKQCVRLGGRLPVNFYLRLVPWLVVVWGVIECFICSQGRGMAEANRLDELGIDFGWVILPLVIVSTCVSTTVLKATGYWRKPTWTYTLVTWGSLVACLPAYVLFVITISFKHHGWN